MNWGVKITLAFSFFVAFILYMVITIMTKDFDLVADDYYAQEINYQEKQQKLTNAHRDGVVVQVELTKEKITLTYPPGTTGTLYFYHASEEDFDKRFPISPDANHMQSIQRDQLVSGHYNLKVDFQSARTEYFQQQKIILM